MMNELRDDFRYLPINTRTRQWGLYVTGCGQMEIPPHGQHPSGSHPELYEFTWDQGRTLAEYQVFFLAEGAGVFESAVTATQDLCRGDVVMLFPGVWHRYRPLPGAGWCTYWIGMGGDYLDMLVKNGFLLPESPVIAAREPGQLVEAYRRVIKLAETDAAGSPLMLSAGAMEILARVLAPIDPGPAEPSTQPFERVVQDRIVAEAVRLIWNRSEPVSTVADLVAQLPTSRRALERRFRSALGRTVLQEITRCRVERAKHLLAQTDLPLKRLAKSAGFSSAERMAKVFHDVEGMSPAAYRKRHGRSR